MFQCKAGCQGRKALAHPVRLPRLTRSFRRNKSWGICRNCGNGSKNRTLRKVIEQLGSGDLDGQRGTGV